jgi:protocatechuate 3,4-dioxygenase alpha subunit
MLTPFQTVGPFLHLGLRYGLGPMRGSGLTTPIVIRGRLIDGAGAGIPDGVLEFWAEGFDAIGRVCTEADGSYRLETRMPTSRELRPPTGDSPIQQTVGDCPPTEAGGLVDAPHFAVRVLARGVLTEYLTRVYFDGDSANERDAILCHVPVDRRATLIAGAVGADEYHFDIVLQGEQETVFFDV